MQKLCSQAKWARQGMHIRVRCHTECICLRWQVVARDSWLNPTSAVPLVRTPAGASWAQAPASAFGTAVQYLPAQQVCCTIPCSADRLLIASARAAIVRAARQLGALQLSDVSVGPYLRGQGSRNWTGRLRTGAAGMAGVLPAAQVSDLRASDGADRGVRRAAWSCRSTSVQLRDRQAYRGHPSARRSCQHRLPSCSQPSWGRPWPPSRWILTLPLTRCVGLVEHTQTCPVHHGLQIW